MVLHRRDIRFAAADAELTADGEAVGFQRLGVELGDDLRLGEVGRTDLDRLEISGYLSAAERVGAAAACDHERKNRRHDRQNRCTRARHTERPPGALAPPGPYRDVRRNAAL